MLTDEELAELIPSEFIRHDTPIPARWCRATSSIQIRRARQREVEARLLASRRS
jgi:hypothetical protein